MTHITVNDTRSFSRLGNCIMILSHGAFKVLLSVTICAIVDCKRIKNKNRERKTVKNSDIQFDFHFASHRKNKWKLDGFGNDDDDFTA